MVGEGNPFDQKLKPHAVGDLYLDRKANLLWVVEQGEGDTKPNWVALAHLAPLATPLFGNRAPRPKGKVML